MKRVIQRFVLVPCLGLVMSLNALGCNDDSDNAPTYSDASLDRGIKASDGAKLTDRINPFDGETKSDDSSTEDGAIDLDGVVSCTPDCSGRVCGMDPVCGTSCGPVCATGQCNNQGQCATVPSSFAVSAGGTDFDFSSDLAVDSTGSALITGYFYGQATFGGTTLVSKGSEDIFVAKVSAFGEVDWAINAGGTSDDEGHSIAVDGNGNALVTGYINGQATFGRITLTAITQRDIFVAKISPSGDVLWAINIGGTNSEGAMGIAADGGGNAYVTGFFKGQTNFGNTTLTCQGVMSDIFVTKISPSGDVLWAISAEGPDLDFGESIAVDSGGNALVTGIFTDQVTFGHTTLISKGNTDTFIAKISPSGDVLWAINVGGSDYDHGTDIAVDSSGNALVTGYFDGQATFGNTTLSSKGGGDIFVTKVSPSGEVLWAINPGGAIEEQPNGITVDGSGNALVTGHIYGQGTATFGSTTLTSKGKRDIFVTEISPSGEVLWASSTGGTDSEGGVAIELDGSGNGLLTGYFKSQVTFDNTTLTPKGECDIFVAKVLLP